MARGCRCHCDLGSTTSLIRSKVLPAPWLAAISLSALAGGCAAVVGGTAGAATGYVAGHEAAEHEVDEHKDRDHHDD
jgi:hypothetical protein